MFSTGRCLWMIGLSWIVYALMILYTWTVIAISNFKWFVKWAGISASRSSYVMSRSKDIFFVVVYVITIIVFLLTGLFSTTYRTDFD
ncbi:hypothetical protein Tcan_07506 [Toxocara canis]|uniref:Uncharacterized protein n=1 Tax=Toxocara canis TaxID=6265 RepID=A0A0B2UUZ5_TOXCA|nr:hypothetical protein Tcan_07506 [Toxocara canis]